MHPRLRYKYQLWIPRALAFARTLRGRPPSDVEREVHDNAEDKWDYFMVFGIQPESQYYVDATIYQLEKANPEDLNLIVTEIRLKWSAEEIRGTKRTRRKR